jgi:transposase
MKIIGCDFHPGYQQIAMLDKSTGELIEKRLSHSHEGEEAKKFYSELSGPVLIGLESSGQSQWFERLLAELGHKLWIGDAAKIRASTDRKQKTDRRDAHLLLDLLEQERFPQIWVPTPAERDVRQLLLHRAKLVRVRTQVKNQLQALALNQCVQRRWKLWTAVGRKQLENLPLLPWASRRRTELLKLLDELDGSITALDGAVCQEANTRPAVRRLMTHPGVGPITALAFTLTLGPAERFRRGKQVASYFGLIPSEHSSGGKQRLGHISKQGSSFVRGLLVEAAQSAVRHEPQLRREYQRLSQRRCRALAKVAIARKLAVRLYWMLRKEVDYAQLLQGSYAGQPESFRGRG